MQVNEVQVLHDIPASNQGLKKTLVVMQPTVLPWAGYFNLMYLSDDFVFFDDVQLEKRSWQTRNRLLLEGKTNWITVPVTHAGLQQKIFETQIAVSQFWIASVRKAFVRNYEKHPHFNEALEIMNFFLDHHSDNLSERNIATIRFIADRLTISTRTHLASEIGISGVRSDRLVKLCEHFKADIYLSPLGAKEYLEFDAFVQHSSSQLLFQNYVVNSYSQANSKEFVPYLSIIDVIANLGLQKTKSYISGNSKN